MKTIELIPKKIDFKFDLLKNISLIEKSIKNSKVLIIGGAGTIGSNYIKVLNFKPSKLVVVDFNEMD